MPEEFSEQYHTYTSNLIGYTATHGQYLKVESMMVIKWLCILAGSGGQFALLSSDNRLFYGTTTSGYAVEVRLLTLACHNNCLAAM